MLTFEKVVGTVVLLLTVIHSYFSLSHCVWLIKKSKKEMQDVVFTSSPIVSGGFSDYLSGCWFGVLYFVLYEDDILLSF